MYSWKHKNIMIPRTIKYFTQKIATTILQLSTGQFFTKARQQKGAKKGREKISNVMKRRHKT